MDQLESVNYEAADLKTARYVRHVGDTDRVEPCGPTDEGAMWYEHPHAYPFRIAADAQTPMGGLISHDHKPLTTDGRAQ
jgi:hypothetical protein